MRKFCTSLLLFLLAVLFAACVQAQNPSNGPTTLILGGTLIDGTGAARQASDVRIQGDHILAIGKLKPLKGEKIIDAMGLIVAPGFIDTHSHADGGLLETPDAETHIRQGITTAIVGQDGDSHFPLADWFAQVEKKHVALNIASFVGHGTVRQQVMGKDYKRVATPDEIKKMQALVTQEMQAGGLGLSSGLEYDPGFYSTTEELIACAQSAAPFGGLYISHVRDEGNDALKSFQELIRIAKEGHLPAQISHIKLGTASVWNRAGDVLQMMEDANKQGVDISADVYPYTYWQSTITVLTLSRDWDNRAVWETALAEVGGADHVLLTNYSPDKSWQGRTIAKLAADTKRDPIAIIQEIVKKTHGEGVTGQESVVVTAMSEEDLKKFIASPRIMFCSDGGLKPTHPRGAGTFPRLLGLYARDQKLLTLEECIRKMTSLPAKRMGLRDRGTLAAGMKADIVLFDASRVRDMATTAHPAVPPLGIPTVFVNGVPVLLQGDTTDARPGMVIKQEVGGRK